MEQQGRALVVRDPAGKADGEDILVKSGVCLGVYIFGEKLLCLHVGLPDLFARDGDCIPQRKRVYPPLGEMTVEELLEGGGCPGRGVDAVRDAAYGVAGEHISGHLAMFHGHAVYELGAVEGKRRHVEVVVLSAPPHQVPALFPEDLFCQALGKLVVAGGYRGVGGEYALLSDFLDHLGVDVCGLSPLRQELFYQCRHDQRGVPLVQVKAFDIFVAEGTQHFDTAHPQDDLLAEAVIAVPSVERVGQAAVLRSVLRKRGVEKVHGYRKAGHSFNRISPCPNVYRAPVQFDRRLCLQGLDEVVHGPAHRVLALVSCLVEFLVKVSLPVEERYGDEGNLEVRCRPDRIPGQDPETSRIGRNRWFQADLHGEICDDLFSFFSHFVRPASVKLSDLLQHLSASVNN